MSANEKIRNLVTKLVEFASKHPFLAGCIAGSISTLVVKFIL